MVKKNKRENKNSKLTTAEHVHPKEKRRSLGKKALLPEILIPWIAEVENNYRLKKKRKKIRVKDLVIITTEINSKFNRNKAGYTAIQSRTVGQEQRCENRSQFRNVTVGRTDGRTDKARCRVACPRLRTQVIDFKLLPPVTLQKSKNNQVSMFK